MDRQNFEKNFTEFIENDTELDKAIKEHVEKRYKEILKERRLKRGRNNNTDIMEEVKREKFLK